MKERWAEWMLAEWMNAASFITNVNWLWQVEVQNDWTEEDLWPIVWYMMAWIKVINVPTGCVLCEAVLGTNHLVQFIQDNLQKKDFHLMHLAGNCLVTCDFQVFLLQLRKLFHRKSYIIQKSLLLWVQKLFFSGQNALQYVKQSLRTYSWCSCFHLKLTPQSHVCLDSKTLF